METSTQNAQESEFFKTIEAIVSKQEEEVNDADISKLAECIFRQTQGLEEESKPLIRLIFEKLSVECGVKVTTALIQLKSAKDNIMAIQRSAQFGTSNTYKW